MKGTRRNKCRLLCGFISCLHKIKTILDTRREGRGGEGRGEEGEMRREVGQGGEGGEERSGGGEMRRRIEGRGAQERRMGERRGGGEGRRGGDDDGRGRGDK